jgi:hypothetical protein
MDVQKPLHRSAQILPVPKSIRPRTMVGEINEKMLNAEGSGAMHDPSPLGGSEGSGYLGLCSVGELTAPVISVA